MSTAVAERLDFFVTSKPPPCEMMVHGEECGNPSYYKVKRVCQCGIRSTRHLCEPCYFNLIVEAVVCVFCLRVITGWTLA
jgi:hypothetical protein